MKTIQKKRVSDLTYRGVRPIAIKPLQKLSVNHPRFEINELLDAGHEVIRIKEVLDCGYEMSKPETYYYKIECEKGDITLSETELQQRLAITAFL